MSNPLLMYGCESCTIEEAEYEEMVLLNCGESLGLQGDQNSQC